MSKMDNLRAMREARYEAAAARAKKGGVAPTRATPASSTDAVKPKATKKRAAAKPAPEATGEATEELCGHRNMSGRTCTREKGHSAKSHRYS